jgi:hypothetical protein
MAFEYKYGKYSSKDKMPNANKPIGRGSGARLDYNTKDQMPTIGGKPYREARRQYPERHSQFDVHSDIPLRNPRQQAIQAGTAGKGTEFLTESEYNYNLPGRQPMHEQSETIQRPSGAYNVYGGTQYPLRPEFGFEKSRYPDVPSAVNAAQWRSAMGGGPEGGQSPSYGFTSQPSTNPWADFIGQVLSYLGPGMAQAGQSQQQQRPPQQQQPQQQQQQQPNMIDQLVKQIMGGPAQQQQQGNPGTPTNQVGGGTQGRDRGGY